MGQTLCPICLFTNEMKRVAVVDSHDILLCPVCFVQWISPAITEEQIKQMYEEYFEYWNNTDSILNDVKKQTFTQYIKKLKSYKNIGNLLDIGASEGFLLEVAQNAGFNIFGIELSEYASNISKNKFGNDKIHTGTIKTAEFTKSYFDVITMCDIFEHIKDPVDTLKSASLLLKDDGCIILVTPNYNSVISYFAKIFRQKYSLEHLHYFNRKTIKKICELTELDIIDTKSAWKVTNINHLYLYLKQYKMFPLYYIFRVFKFVPFICKINFKMPSGSLMYILKKHRTR